MADYTREQKQLAIGVIQRCDGILSQEALRDIRTLLAAPKLNKTTIYRWWQSREQLVATPQPKKKADTTPQLGKPQLQPDATQQEIDQTLAGYFARTAMNYLDHANKEEVIADVKGDRAIVGAATAVDKMRVLLNLPTEIIQILPDVIQAIEKTGRNPFDFLSQVKAKCDAEYLH